MEMSSLVDRTCGECRRKFSTMQKLFNHWFEKRCTQYNDDMVVEKIVGKKISAGVVLYRIRWQNWSCAWDEWIPKNELLNCKNKIRDYEKRIRIARKRRVRMIGYIKRRRNRKNRCK